MVTIQKNQSAQPAAIILFIRGLMGQHDLVLVTVSLAHSQTQLAPIHQGKCLDITVVYRLWVGRALKQVPRGHFMSSLGISSES